MTGNTRGLQRGSSRFPDPTEILGSAADSRKKGGILWVGLPGIQGCDAGGPAVPHHLQHGGGCGGEAQVRGDGRGGGREVRVWTGGKTPKLPLLHG